MFVKPRYALSVIFLIAWPFVYFLPVTLGQGVWFGLDTVRFYYPVGFELARAFSEGRLPLWSPGVSAGFPLFAEGQAGALYPVHWLLYRVLPPHFALSYDILLHLAWAACGMYLCARALTLNTAGALLAGFVFSFNGFMLTQLHHAPVIIASSWLPWLIFLQARFQRAWEQKSTRADVWFALITLAFGMLFLSGFPQIAFLNTLTFAMFGIVGGLPWNRFTALEELHYPWMPRTMLQLALGLCLPIVLGAGIAAAQLLPTTELIGYSVRRGTFGEVLGLSYALPLDFLTQFISPFAPGEPIDFSAEYWAYIGLAMFVFAGMAPILRRDRWTFFLGAFALCALTLALGGLNPAYHLIYRLPIFSFFRVPARYLLPFVFAASLLGAMGYEVLAKRLPEPAASKNKVITLILGFTLLVFFLILLAHTQPVEFWLNLWQILPLPLFLLSLIAIWLARTRRWDRATWSVAVFCLIVFDLSCYAPIFHLTINKIMAPSYVTAIPRSIPALETGPTKGRFYTDLSEIPNQAAPSLPALRGSLYQNTALLYGKESAQIYSPLALAGNDEYVAHPSPTMLNLLNVRYFMVPLEPRPRNKSSTPFDFLSLDIINYESALAPKAVIAIEIASFTEHAENLSDGTLIGEIDVRLADGRTESFPLRAGIETADWDDDRKKTLGQVQHSRAQIAHSFPAYWRSFGRPFEGHTYHARFDIAYTGQPRDIIGVNVRAVQPEAGLTVESLSLVGADNRAISLATLTHKNNFSLAYLSDTVAAWENEDAMPRAFVVHAAEIANDDAAFARLHENGFRADRLVVLSQGEAMQAPDDADSGADRVVITNYKPEQVSLSVNSQRPGYLVLSDSWYPGWNASVDGRPVPIYRADVIFRAVPIEPGQHTVVFEYRPMSFVLGAAISVVSILAAGGIAALWARGSRGTL